MKELTNILILLVVFTLVKCNHLPFQGAKNKMPLDTLLDYSSVDVPPTFKACQDYIDKQKKTECFRTTLSSLLVKELNKKENKKQLKVRSKVDEVVALQIRVDKKGDLSLENVSMSNKLSKELPAIKMIFKKAINELPKTDPPALKRGIPVTTQYSLPVHIKLATLDK